MLLLLLLALLAYVQEVEVEVGSRGRGRGSSSSSGSIELLPMMLSTIVDALYALRCMPACASLHWHCAALCCATIVFCIFSCDSNFTHEIPEMLSYFRLMIY